MTTESIIHCNGATKSYRHDFTRKAATALHNLDFEVLQGEVFGIVGPNGAGKSTTLKLLMGFIRADRGEIRLFGRPPTDAAVHQRIGYLPENPCLYDNLTLIDHLRFAARTTGYQGSVDARIEELLALVDLGRAAYLPIRRFSKGMTQRAALAYALFHEPELLILDEPMSGLDPLGRQLVVDLIRDYNARGNTILFCSHILSDVERICNRIAIMNKGTLQTVITPEELQSYTIPPGLPEIISPLEAFFLDCVQPGNSP
jgi:ABC-2 type transport system ATP-binding protein